MNSLMRLRAYSESDSEEEEFLEERLPLPNFLENPSKTLLPTEVNKDGKIRNFPHEPGNWATYIYVAVNSDKCTDFLNTLSNHFHPLALKVVNDFHISLTKTVILRHHWIPDFVSSIKNNLCDIKQFKLYLSGLKVYVNETKTRSFLSVKVTEGEDNLSLVVNRLTNCLKDYNLEGVYESNSFHVSLLWCPGDKFSEINKFIDSLPVSFGALGFYEKVTYCVCATGNKQFSFNFC